MLDVLISSSNLSKVSGASLWPAASGLQHIDQEQTDTKKFCERGILGASATQFGQEHIAYPLPRQRPAVGKSIPALRSLLSALP